MLGMTYDENWAHIKFEAAICAVGNFFKRAMALTVAQNNSL